MKTTPETRTIDEIVKAKFKRLSDQELINRANAAADFCWDDEGAEIDRRMRENGLKCEMQGNKIVIL